MLMIGFASPPQIMVNITHHSYNAMCWFEVTITFAPRWVGWAHPEIQQRSIQPRPTFTFLRRNARIINNRAKRYVFTDFRHHRFSSSIHFILNCGFFKTWEESRFLKTQQHQPCVPKWIQTGPSSLLSSSCNIRASLICALFVSLFSYLKYME
jgi:hypothetical protein